MDRLTKLALTAWTCAALALQIWLLHDTWTELAWLAVGSAVILAIAASFDQRAVGAVLVTAYIFPVIVQRLRGVASPDYSVIWMAALFGVMLPDLLKSPWRMPVRWRVPLVYSALVVAVAVPIVLTRELDGHPWLLFGPQARFWTADPWFLARWSMHVALSLMIGLLFFEHLFAGKVDVERVIVPSLAISALLMGLAAAYQRLVDAHFLNGTMFEVLGRATGTMYDANVMGMVGAFWIGGVSLWAAAGPRWRLKAAAPAVAVLAIAVWASGSRTSFAAAAAALLGVGLSLVFEDGRLVVRRAIPAAIMVLVMGAAGAAFAFAHQQGQNPLSRLADFVVSQPTAGALFSEVWNRNGYGVIATEMIREWPASGAGVGAFHGMSELISTRMGMHIAPDNAQNWLRHQVAEFGFLGALGWLVWTLSFAVAVCRIRRGEPSRIWIARGTLLAFGAISLVGMPGQDPMVGVTFWVFAYWYCRLSGLDASSAPTRGSVWLGIAVPLVLFVASSSVTARTTLRTSERARRLHVGFAYGIGPASNKSGEEGFRAINSDAALLEYPRGPWMTVSLQRANRDGRTDPADVRVWADGAVLLKAQLAPGGRFATTVHSPSNPEGPVLFETRVRQSGRERPLFPPLESDVLLRLDFSDASPAAVREYDRPEHR